MPTPTKFGRHPSPRSLVILRANRHTHTHPGDHNICSVIGAQGVSPMKHAAFMKPYVFRSVRKQTSCKGLTPWKTADTETAKIDDLPPSIIISARGAVLAYNGRRIDFRRTAAAYTVQRARRDKTSGLPPPVVPRTTSRTQPGEHARPQQRQHCFSSQHPPPAPFSILSLDRYTHSPSAMFRRHEIITLVPGCRRRQRDNSRFCVLHGTAGRRDGGEIARNTVHYS